MEGASCPSRGPGLGKNCGVRVVGLQGLGICLARAVDSQFRAPVGFGAVGILWVLMFHVERALFRGGAGSAGGLGPLGRRQSSDAWEAPSGSGLGDMGSDLATGIAPYPQGGVLSGGVPRGTLDPIDPNDSTRTWPRLFDSRHFTQG